MRAEIWAELERAQKALAEQRTLAAERAAALAAQTRRVDQREQELDDLQVELRALRQELIASRQRQDQLSASYDHARAEAEHLKRKLDESATTARLREPVTGLGEVLAIRGLVGADETALLVRGLGEQRHTATLTQLLCTEHPAILLDLLNDRASLWCGDSACPVPPGRVVLRVAATRCDVCGGGDLRRAVRRFVDAILVTGQRRVTIIGGSPSTHRQVRALIADNRIQLSLIHAEPGTLSRQLQSARDGADVLVCWSPHAVNDLPPGVVAVTARPITALLEAIAASVHPET